MSKQLKPAPAPAPAKAPATCHPPKTDPTGGMGQPLSLGNHKKPAPSGYDLGPNQRKITPNAPFEGDLGVVIAGDNGEEVGRYGSGECGPIDVWGGLQCTTSGW